MSLGTLIKRLQDIMRKDTGVDGDAQRLAQIVWIIFLKIFDYKEEEAELSDNFDPVIPEGYRWRDWAIAENVKDLMTGPELIDFVNNKLIPVLSGDAINVDDKQVVIFEKTTPRAQLVKSFMADAENYMKNGYLLREVIDLFEEIKFEDAHSAHEFNEIYETLLRGLQSAGTMGEFYTGRAITKFCVEMVDPQIGGTVADWACGTGGFLVDALAHMKEQIPFGDVEKEKQLQKAVRGGEFKPMPYKLATTNLLLHGIEMPNIRYGDSLAEKNFSDYMGLDLVDYALLNPPYGGVALPEDKMAFPADFRSSETADLFVALTIKRLKQGGKAAIVLPDGFLFNSDNSKAAIKSYLLNECNLHTIIRLPQSCFAPYTSIATNLLFFDKTGKTQETWFYRLDMPSDRKHFSKTKPMMPEHFQPVRDWWNNRVEIKDEKDELATQETWKSKKFTYDELVKKDDSGKIVEIDLDKCGYPVEEKIILSPEETITNFIAHREELERKMDQQLEEIKKLLGV